MTDEIIPASHLCGSHIEDAYRMASTASDKSCPASPTNLKPQGITVLEYRKKPDPRTIEAMQWPDETMGVEFWMELSGYPWLVGNALDPLSLSYHDVDMAENPDLPTITTNGPLGTQFTFPARGIWINPADGALMIRDGYADLKVRSGDYVVFSHGRFYALDADIFNANYEPCGD